ncbi:MAG: response regulator [Candidatus Paceibacteria bacterium]
MNKKIPKCEYSILIVDDDRFLLDMYSLKFKECGSTVTAEPDPMKALELLRKGTKPQVILLDIIMPGLSGFDFLGAIRKEKLADDATIIVLSNQGQEEDIKKATDLGADGYIVKASAIPSEVLEKTLEFADKKFKK